MTVEPAPPASTDDVVESADVEAAAVPVADVSPAPSWPDDTVESAFRAEAQERGEPVLAAKLPSEVIEEVDATPLPPLEDLVQRIPPNVRETLEDLFRVVAQHPFRRVRGPWKEGSGKSLPLNQNGFHVGYDKLGKSHVVTMASASLTRNDRALHPLIYILGGADALFQ